MHATVSSQNVGGIWEPSKEKWVGQCTVQYNTVLAEMLVRQEPHHILMLLQHPGCSQWTNCLKTTKCKTFVLRYY
jgi:hypothetical protein